MHTIRVRRTRAAAAAVGLTLGTLVLAGCGGSAATPAAPSAAASAPAVASSAPAAAASSAAADAGTVVEVTMTEFALEFSQQSFTPGTYTFRAPNEGQFPHTISITGPGVDNVTAGGPAQTGQEVSMTVDLQPGTYKIWCPVRDHEARGMVTEITVT
jgi:plastocyanin